MMSRAAIPSRARLCRRGAVGLAAAAVFLSAGLGGPAARAAEPPAPADAAARAAPADLPVCRGEWASRIVCMSGHRTGPVVSAWLVNGVRVHHLRLESAPGVVSVTVSFFGGELRETAANRGVSIGACSAWEELSAAKYPPAAIPSAMSGRAIRIEAAAGLDVMQLRVACPRVDLEEAMRVVGAMLDEPRVTPAGLKSAMENACRRYKSRLVRTETLVADAIADVMFPTDDARLRFPTGGELDAVSVKQAQAWLDEHLAGAPVEAAIAGDITLDDAMRLAAGFLGNLPERKRPSPQVFASMRRLPPPAFPVRREIARPIEPGQAVLVAGFAGADAAQPSELRLLRVAARVLDDRATAALRDAGFADPQVGAAAIPSTVYPGYGVVAAYFECAADRAEDAERALSLAMETLCAGHPAAPATDAEVAAAAEDLAQAVEHFERQPWYWSGIMSRCDATGTPIDAVAGGAEYYRSITAARVNDAIRRYHADGRTLQVRIVPEPGAPAASR